MSLLEPMIAVLGPDAAIHRHTGRLPRRMGNRAETAAPALTDLVGGQIRYVISTVPAAMGFVRGGQVKPLAATSLARAAALPDVPLANDVVPGMAGELWVGVYAPKGVPREALEAMRAGVAKVQATPDWEAYCASQGAAPMKAGATELASMTRQEIDKWGPLVREIGMQID